jgi:hypothetical protein
MLLRTPGFIAAVILLLFVFFPTASAQTAATGSTAATVAMLVTQTPTAATRQKLESALRDADPKVRATAVRVAWALSIADLGKPISEALAKRDRFRRRSGGDLGVTVHAGSHGHSVNRAASSPHRGRGHSGRG